MINPRCCICKGMNSEDSLVGYINMEGFSCLTCGNIFCQTCLENHNHCVDCEGSGVYTWNVLRNSAGEIDYMNGSPTGETQAEPCRRCDETGREL